MTRLDRVPLDGGYVASRIALRLIWKLEDDGIGMVVTPDGSTVLLSPANRVATLPYLDKLRAHKTELVELLKYIEARERKQSQAATELKAGDIAWGSEAS